MTLTRRDLLKTASALTATAFVPLTGCAEDDHSQPADETVFAQGVASGDPLTDRVILWTRIDPAADPGDAVVGYDVSTNRRFDGLVASGTVTTNAAKDFTVKVDVEGLRPGTTYYYRFYFAGSYSAEGRTKTAPEGGVSHLRFAMCSCSNFGFGYFHAYARIAERDDIDAVLHLGDYIYEFGADGIYPPASSALRPWDPPNELLTLADYRTRYRQYRSDPDLRAAHQRHPWITTWDDHEIANDTWIDGAQNHDPALEGSFDARRLAATQAMYEYLPIRGLPNDPATPMYRAFRYGDLAEVIFLDTRNEGRDEQLTNVGLDTPERHLISATQEAWLSETLSATTSRWKILAQQVMVAPFTLDGTHVPYYLDQWDGYPAARQRLYDILESVGGADVVVLTGDIHGSFAAELPRDPWSAGYDPATGAGALAVEFVCPGLTSPGFPGGLFENDILGACPHMKLAEWAARGYVVLDVTHDRIQADWFFLDGIAQDQGEESFGAGLVVNTGDSHLVLATKPAS